MREIVGFVMGAAAGAAGALFVSSPEGRALLERLRDEARPEVDRATTEWEPVLREVGRAVRLAARELETATADFRARVGEIATAVPGETTGADEASALPAADDTIVGTDDIAGVDSPGVDEIAAADAAADRTVADVTPGVDDIAPGA